MQGIFAGGTMAGAGNVTARDQADLLLAEREDEIRMASRHQKVQFPTSANDFRFNTVLDEITGIKVRLERIQAMQELPGGSPRDQQLLQVKEQAFRVDLEGLRMKRDLCVRVKEQHDLGNEELAEQLYKEYLHEEQGLQRNPDVERLLKKAKLEVKESQQMKFSAAMTQAQSMWGDIGASLQAQTKSLQQLAQGSGSISTGSPAKPGRVVKQGGPAAGGPAAGADGMSQFQRTFKMHWVDAEVYHESLKGKLAPHPRAFPSGDRWAMDAAGTKGLVTPAGSKVPCAFCSTVGHQHSECPAREEQKNGKTYVNFRWLYEAGMCTARGQSK
jgi:hypothetical protein